MGEEAEATVQTSSEGAEELYRLDLVEAEMVASSCSEAEHEVEMHGQNCMRPVVAVDQAAAAVVVVVDADSEVGLGRVVAQLDMAVPAWLGAGLVFGLENHIL